MSPDVEALQRLVARDQGHDCEGYGPARVCVRVAAVAELPTRVGHFQIVAFYNNRDAKEHVAMSRATSSAPSTCPRACTPSA